jgi:hypothetical protein
MAPLEKTRRSLGWFILGYLLTTVLITLLAFLSPFWATVRYTATADRLDHARDLLTVGRPLTAFFSVCFVVGAWHLAGTARSLPVRVALVCLALVLFLSHMLPLFLDSPARDFVSFGRDFIEMFAVVAFTSLVWRNLRGAH